MSLTFQCIIFNRFLSPTTFVLARFYSDAIRYFCFAVVEASLRSTIQRLCGKTSQLGFDNNVEIRAIICLIRCVRVAMMIIIILNVWIKCEEYHIFYISSQRIPNRVCVYYFFFQMSFLHLITYYSWQVTLCRNGFPIPSDILSTLSTIVLQLLLCFVIYTVH